jgi:hypothetical protein
MFNAKLNWLAATFALLFPEVVIFMLMATTQSQMFLLPAIRHPEFPETSIFWNSLERWILTIREKLLFPQDSLDPV